MRRQRPRQGLGHHLAVDTHPDVRHQLAIDDVAAEAEDVDGLQFCGQEPRQRAGGVRRFELGPAAQVIAERIGVERGAHEAAGRQPVVERREVDDVAERCPIAGGDAFDQPRVTRGPGPDGASRRDGEQPVAGGQALERVGGQRRIQDGHGHDLARSVVGHHGDNRQSAGDLGDFGGFELHLAE